MVAGGVSFASSGELVVFTMVTKAVLVGLLFLLVVCPVVVVVPFNLLVERVGELAWIAMVSNGYDFLKRTSICWPVTSGALGIWLVDVTISSSSTAHAGINCSDAGFLR